MVMGRVGSRAGGAAPVPPIRALVVTTLLVVSSLAASFLVQLVVEPGVAAAAGDTPFHGLGTWVDAYDYAAPYQASGAPAPVTPASVDDMARLGVRTIYFQAAKADPRSPGALVDDRLAGEFLARAHRDGVRVVAWYLPLFSDLAADLAHVRAIHDFESDGQRFDGVALDIEWTQGVPDPTQRNARLVSFTKRVRKVVGDSTPLGAIVYPAVQLELLNTTLWPKFPYRKLAPMVDVWMPMVYWTFRTADYRDAFFYTDDSVSRLRTRLHDRNAAVHPIGGIADSATPTDYERFLQAVGTDHAVGWSVYDYNTTVSSAWPRLRAGPPAGG
jgi:uncharacterized lipoprotein YddW (UPF0748 family)